MSNQQSKDSRELPTEGTGGLNPEPTMPPASGLELEIYSEPLKLYLDMDNFFASCEAFLREELRDRPIAIVRKKFPGAKIIAASKDAKDMNVRNGLTVSESHRLCKDLQVIEARDSLYEEIHLQIRSVLENIFDPKDVIPYYIDEFACIIPSGWRDKKNAVEVIERVRKDIHNAFKGVLTTTVVAGPNAFLAKVFGKMLKELNGPNQWMVIDESYPKEFLNLKLKSLTGIGKNRLENFGALGILEVRDLWNAPIAVVEEAWGNKEGRDFVRRIRGDPTFDIRPAYESRKSHGLSRSIPPRVGTPKQVRSLFFALLETGLQDLRKALLVPKTLSIAIGYYDEGFEDQIFGFQRKGSLKFHSNLDPDWTALLDELLKDSPKTRRPSAAMVFLGFTELVPQASLLGTLLDGLEKRERLMQAIDELRTKHGAIVRNLAGFGNEEYRKKRTAFHPPKKAEE